MGLHPSESLSLLLACLLAKGFGPPKEPWPEGLPPQRSASLAVRVAPFGLRDRLVPPPEFNYPAPPKHLRHSSSTQPEGVCAGRPPPREFAHWIAKDKTDTVGLKEEPPVYRPQHPNTRTPNPPRRLSLTHPTFFLSPGLWCRGITPYTARLCAPDSCGGQEVSCRPRQAGAQKGKRHPWATALRGFRRSTVMTKSKQATGNSNRNY